MVLIQDGLIAVGGGAALSALLWGLFVQREGIVFQGVYTFAIGIMVFGAVLAGQWFGRLLGI